MTTKRPYGMICPITRACDVLEPRWTIPILVSLWAGEMRFNDMRRYGINPRHKQLITR